LWVKCVKLKYISPLIVLVWFRCPTKCRINVSICYKVVLQSYDLNGTGLSWKVGDEKFVRVGDDPWVGCHWNNKLPSCITGHLITNGFPYSINIVDSGDTGHTCEGWLTAES